VPPSFCAGGGRKTVFPFLGGSAGKDLRSSFLLKFLRDGEAGPSPFPARRGALDPLPLLSSPLPPVLPRKREERTALLPLPFRRLQNEVWVQLSLIQGTTREDPFLSFPCAGRRIPSPPRLAASFSAKTILNLPFP